MLETLTGDGAGQRLQNRYIYIKYEYKNSSKIVPLSQTVSGSL